MGHDGYCLHYCPELFVVDKYTGKCKFQDYTRHVNAKYTFIVGIILAVLLIVAILVFIKLYFFNKPK